MRPWCQRRLAGGLLVIVTALALPAAATAHGPVDPAASSFLARISQVPAGFHGLVVDGDQRLWLQVVPTRTVVVLDYRGATYAGRWRIPLEVDGAGAAIVGGLYFRPSPSIVWFWPIIVALACILAAMRLRREPLDERVARGLAALALAAFGLAAVGQELHGRPTVSIGQEITLAVMLAFVVWGARRLAVRRHGWFTFFVIAALAIWEGASRITVLLDGYVLQALPAALARVAVVACLSSGLALLPLVFAMAERPTRRRVAGRARDGGAAVAGEDPDQVQEAWQPGA